MTARTRSTHIGDPKAILPPLVLYCCRMSLAATPRFSCSFNSRYFWYNWYCYEYSYAAIVVTIGLITNTLTVVALPLL